MRSARALRLCPFTWKCCCNCCKYISQSQELQKQKELQQELEQLKQWLNRSQSRCRFSCISSSSFSSVECSISSMAMWPGATGARQGMGHRFVQHFMDGWGAKLRLKFKQRLYYLCQRCCHGVASFCSHFTPLLTIPLLLLHSSCSIDPSIPVANNFFAQFLFLFLFFFFFGVVAYKKVA